MSARRSGGLWQGADGRIMSEEACTAIWQRLTELMRGGGTMDGGIVSRWSGELRWARNRPTLSSDRRNTVLAVYRKIDGRTGGAMVNQFDDASLAAVVRAAERAAGLEPARTEPDFAFPVPSFGYPATTIWSDATYNCAAEARGRLGAALIAPAAAKGMLSAGYLEMRAVSAAAFRTGYAPLYTAFTEAQCSLTVRDGGGAGSGWAGLSSYDWEAIDAEALAAQALEKALASRNPVALEPGRYTVILEPQAVHDLVNFVLESVDRETAERGGGPWTLGRDPALGLVRTKLGLKVVDERITIDHDPGDPRLGVIPFDGSAHQAPVRPITWIDRGVLVALADYRGYALRTRNENLPYSMVGAFRMSGGETSLEEMIRTTKRGLLVTRFSNLRVLDNASLLATGLTRDGLWLIENGQITKAVKNFRFTESPLFVLNNIEQLGEPVPVFRPMRGEFDSALRPAIVPPLKARDFSFTSTIDAI